MKTIKSIKMRAEISALRRVLSEIKHSIENKINNLEIQIKDEESNSLKHERIPDDTE